MATNGNPQYIVNTYYPSGQLSGFAYYDDAESMLRNYRGAVSIKKAYGERMSMTGRVAVVRCSDSQEILDPEGEANK